MLNGLSSPDAPFLPGSWLHSWSLMEGKGCQSSPNRSMREFCTYNFGRLEKLSGKRWQTAMQGSPWR